MICNLTNVTDTEITLDDLRGTVIAPGETVDGLAFGEAELRASTSVATALLSGSLTLFDGFLTYTGNQALDLIRGYATQRTVDGKPITTVSDRPANTYRCFMGRGDDITSNPPVIGGGTPLVFDVAPGDAQVVNIHFADDVFIKDGEISFINAVLNTHLDVDVICPPNIPFPSPTHTGTLDRVGSSFVPNPTNTGAYMTAPVEVRLFRFINRMHLLGSGTREVHSPEPFQLFTPYFLRFTLTNPAGNDKNVQGGIVIGMYRVRTI